MRTFRIEECTVTEVSIDDDAVTVDTVFDYMEANDAWPKRDPTIIDRWITEIHEDKELHHA